MLSLDHSADLLRLLGEPNRVRLLANYGLKRTKVDWLMAWDMED